MDMSFFTGEYCTDILCCDGFKHIMKPFPKSIKTEVHNWVGDKHVKSNDVPYCSWTYADGYLGFGTSHHLLLFATQYKEGAVILGVYYKKSDQKLTDAAGILTAICKFLVHT